MTLNRISVPKHPFFSVILAPILAFTAVNGHAVSCTPQAEMTPADWQAVSTASSTLASQIASQQFDTLQANLLPAVIPDWDSIRGVAQSAATELKGGTAHLRNAYLLDASDLKGPNDAQFFCTNTDGSLTITLNLHALPPGKYALVINDFQGAPLAGQLAMILGFDTQWKLGGLFVREGALDGHDGVWYWTRAREQAKKPTGWDAWFSYDTARWLLLPVDFLSSPNLEKLNAEQMRLKNSPIDAMPMSVKAAEGTNSAAKSWRVTSLHLDTTLHTPDLALTYESTGLTDPQAARAEAIAVMSGLLILHPELRTSFHGLWAYAEKDGKRSYAIEAAMHDIP